MFQVVGPLVIVAIHVGVWATTGSHGAAFMYALVPLLLLLPRARLPEGAATPREDRHADYWSATLEAFGGLRYLGSAVVAAGVVGLFGVLFGWYSIDALVLGVLSALGIGMMVVIARAAWGVGQRTRR